MMIVRSTLAALVSDERGQDLIEYALLTAAIGFASIAVWDLLRAAIGNTYGSWETGVNNIWVSPNPSGS
jgi:Flp pilus assembly pilin Flp